MTLATGHPDALILAVGVMLGALTFGVGYGLGLVAGRRR